MTNEYQRAGQMAQTHSLLSANQAILQAAAAPRLPAGEIRSFHSAKRVYFSPWVSALFVTWAISLCKLYYNGLQTNYKSNIWFYTDSK